MDKEDMVPVYNRILLSHKKINEILPLERTWMNLEGIMLSEMNQREKMYCMISLICGI